MKGFERLLSKEAMFKFYITDNDEAIKLKPESLTPTQRQLDRAKTKEELDMLNTFGKSFPSHQNFELINVTKLFSKKPRVRINGRILAMEIIKQNMQTSDPVIMILMLVAIFYVMVPYIIHVIFNEGDFFQSQNHKTAFWLLTIPTFIYYFLNSVLLGALRLFYQQKIRYKEAILSALDDELRERFI